MVMQIEGMIFFVYMYKSLNSNGCGCCLLVNFLPSSTCPLSTKCETRTGSKAAAGLETASVFLWAVLILGKLCACERIYSECFYLPWLIGESVVELVLLFVL